MFIEEKKIINSSEGPSKIARVRYGNAAKKKGCSELTGSNATLIAPIEQIRLCRLSLFFASSLFHVFRTKTSTNVRACRALRAAISSPVTSAGRGTEATRAPDRCCRRTFRVSSPGSSTLARRFSCANDRAKFP